MGKLGTGRAQAITDKDIADLATKWKCHPAAIEAISDVESAGFGWFDDGRMKILFEKHWFYKLVAPGNRDKAVKAGLARKSWISPKNGGYNDQKTASQRYSLLSRAIALDPEAAYQSISMGRYQIMGFNHKICKFVTAKEMFVLFCDSEAYQLQAFANFMEAKKLVPAIREPDFNAVEQKYNGGGLGGAYARRMERFYKEGLAGKWKGWAPGKQVPVPTPKPTRTKEPVPGERTENTWTPDKSDDLKGLIIVIIALGAFAAFLWRKIRGKP